MPDIIKITRQNAVIPEAKEIKYYPYHSKLSVSYNGVELEEIDYVNAYLWACDEIEKFGLHVTPCPIETFCDCFNMEDTFSCLFEAPDSMAPALYRHSWVDKNGFKRVLYKSLENWKELIASEPDIYLFFLKSGAFHYVRQTDSERASKLAPRH